MPTVKNQIPMSTQETNKSESEPLYRIAYTVGNASEHRTEYVGELLTLQEAQKQAAELNKAEARAVPKGGLGSAAEPVNSTYYFYEQDVIRVLRSVLAAAGGRMPEKLETEFYRSESGKIELHFEGDDLLKVRTPDGQYLWDASFRQPNSKTLPRLLAEKFTVEVLRKRLDGNTPEGRVAACLGPILGIALHTADKQRQDDIYKQILSLWKNSGATFLESRMNDPINGSYHSSTGEVEMVLLNGGPHEVYTVAGLYTVPTMTNGNLDKFLTLLGGKFEVVKVPDERRTIGQLFTVTPKTPIKDHQFPWIEVASFDIGSPMTCTRCGTTGTLTHWIEFVTVHKHCNAPTTTPESETIFLRVRQLMSDAGWTFNDPHETILSIHPVQSKRPSASGLIELALDCATPNCVRAPEGEYRFGVRTGGDPTKFRALLESEFDVSELSPELDYVPSTDITGPVLSIKRKKPE